MNRPILTRVRPYRSALYSSMLRNDGHPASCTDLVSFVRASPATDRSSTAIPWSSPGSRPAPTRWAGSAEPEGLARPDTHGECLRCQVSGRKVPAVASGTPRPRPPACAGRPAAASPAAGRAEGRNEPRRHGPTRPRRARSAGRPGKVRPDCGLRVPRLSRSIDIRRLRRYVTREIYGQMQPPPSSPPRLLPPAATSGHPERSSRLWNAAVHRPAGLADPLPAGLLRTRPQPGGRLLVAAAVPHRFHHSPSTSAGPSKRNEEIRYVSHSSTDASPEPVRPSRQRPHKLSRCQDEGKPPIPSRLYRDMTRRLVVRQLSSAPRAMRRSPVREGIERCIAELASNS